MMEYQGFSARWDNKFCHLAIGQSKFSRSSRSRRRDAELLYIFYQSSNESVLGQCVFKKSTAMSMARPFERTWCCRGALLSVASF